MKSSPRFTASARSSITRWSHVRNGSHSQPFNITKRTRLPLGTLSFTWVGKAAPPIPTKPPRWSSPISVSASAVAMSGSSIGSTFWLEYASVAITMVSVRLPAEFSLRSMAFTVPVTGACR